ncbi:MAG: FAD-dependent oxidoreductase [Pseudomonadota bacterium]
METTGVLIAGGGIAGLSAAARLAADGHEVVLVDPAPADGPKEPDLRTTAILQPGIATLAKAGVWDGLEGLGAPLCIMRIVDAGGRDPVPRETADFDAETAGHDLFGWNVPNQPAKDALGNALRVQSNVRLINDTRVTGFTPRLDQAIVRLSDGTQIGAKLVLAADGRESTLRGLAGINHRRWAYGQKALVCAVTHPRPHDGVSTEIHRTGGPLTLVPMPDFEGLPCSSIVWMMPGRQASDLAQQDDSGISQALTQSTMNLFGPLQITGPKAIWPIISQVALSVRGPRLALAAEAAHVMPPIGAQGLNTSLHDVETLAGLIKDAPDPGAPELLDRYQMQILPRTMARVAGVDLLNRAAQAEAQPIRDLRRLGLSATNRIKPLRDLAIRTGLGVSPPR